MGFFVVRNLREIRKKKYPMARDFAKECGLSVKTIHRAERGMGKIGFQSISAMAKALEINTEELIRKGDKEEEQGEEKKEQGEGKKEQGEEHEEHEEQEADEEQGEDEYEGEGNMGRMKVWMDVVSDARALADSLQYALDMMLENDEEGKINYHRGWENKEVYHNKRNKIEGESLEQVRALLAKKSQEGFVEDIKHIIKNYNASKLSDVNPRFYAEIRKSVENLGER